MANGPGGVPAARAGAGRPRLVFVAFYFPPSLASGVYRSRATAQHFADAGWDVTVITPQREFFRDHTQAYDPALEATVSPAVSVDRVPFGGRHWNTDIRSFSRLRGNFPQLSDRLHARWQRRVFPEIYAPWIVPVARRIARLHRQRPVDMVLATGNPNADFAAAWAAGRLTGVPYAIDYRDAWTLNVYDGSASFPEGHPAWAWERRIVRRARRVSFVNEPLRAWHQHRYPDAADRMIVVENGYEPDVLGTAAPRPPDAARPLAFGYLGTLTRHVPLDELFAGWRAAQTFEVLRGADIRLHGYLGYFAHGAVPVRETLRRHAELPVSYRGPVSKMEVSGVYASLDVLLLAIAGSRFVTSGKVYEYMATGKPIVSVHDPACAASDTLADYPLWFPARDLSAGSVAAALVAAATAARRLTVGEMRAAQEVASRYTRDFQLTRLEQELRAEVAPRSATRVGRA